MRAVLTFHSIDDSDSVLSYPPALFARLVESLSTEGVPILPYNALLEAPTGVALTFDDGMRSVAEHALPILRYHGAPAHLFLTTSTIGRTNGWPTQPPAATRYDMLSWSEIEACAAAGITIEGHTDTHPDLRALDDDAIVQECASGDELIEQRIGTRPSYFAYPYGRHDARVRRLLAGRYRACFTTRLAYLGDTPDPTWVPRLDAYFLRRPLLARHPTAGATRLYLALRRMVRIVRGRE